MDIGETFFASDSKIWRDWLEENHDSKNEIWVILNKKHVKDPCMSYDEAVEEALCFGWIDGILKRIDDRQHVIRFSPRRKDSIWSEMNIQRVEKMMESGKMKEIGLAKFNDRDRISTSITVRGSERELPDWLEAYFREDDEVWDGFEKLPPSHRNRYLDWIMMAKRDETRRRRAEKAKKMIMEKASYGMVATK